MKAFLKLSEFMEGNQQIKLADKITLTEVPDNLSRKILSTFMLENPAWLNNKKMNRCRGIMGIGKGQSACISGMAMK